MDSISVSSFTGRGIADSTSDDRERLSKGEESLEYRVMMQIKGMTTEKALSAVETIVEGTIGGSAPTGRGVAVFASEDQEELGKIIEEAISNISFDLVDLQWVTVQ
ncbi:hypothetical protein K493DRAFT_363176 [Basidiobolus meristosporus CBS 931.73]|uniref:Uncharacterized protein n=1 Tax=Basidiobolus meristosporus CBS 931.73 TaxID=1314790 RepID=A0A1Y1WWD4_9FUNG|nr:hypothetical protein K493DRAFT_363176 [Basidiobolus meristosporus CBS 931.73]|eukprot:ORX77840.1 hypothetical protein K493DRAFT_363176 [Basidiobolus meristosporus CBS 931.73]